MRRIAIVVIAAIVIVPIGAFAWRIFGPGPLAFAGRSTVALTDYREASPTGVPADLAKADAIRRGEYLAKAADCMVCHTMPSGEAFAGGLAFPLPFGTLYSTNITPDNETGIGNYTDQDFLNAVRQGIRKDGARLYPAMPYTSYTFMIDADALAIKAYLFSLPAAQKQNQRDTLRFPFNQRWAMIFWSWAFNPNTRFAPNAAKSAEWNRGAYIAEALAHCGDCHTPRNLAFALDNRWNLAAPSLPVGAPITSLPTKARASVHGAMRRSLPISPKVTPWAAARRPGLWAKRSIAALTRWSQRISGRS